MEEFVERFKNIVQNETITKDDVDFSINNAIIHNYQTLLTEQRAVCGVRKYTFPLSEMRNISKLENDNYHSHDWHSRVGYRINDVLIKYDKRYLLQSYGIIGKSLTREEMNTIYKEVFEYSYLFFIGNKLINCVRASITDEYTTFIINLSNSPMVGCITKSTFNQFINSDEMVTLYIVPTYIVETLSLNHPTIMDKNNGKIELSRFTTGDSFTENTLFFINDSPDTEVKSLISCTVDDNWVNIDDTSYLNQVRYGVTAITFPNFVIQGHFTEDGWFQLNNVDVPVPSMNMIFLVESDSNDKSKMNDITLDVYYPNIYHISNIGKTTKVLLGYFYDNSSWVKYENKLWLLYKYIPNMLKLYETDKIADAIKNYHPVNIPYYHDVYSDKVHLPYNFAFKTDKLAEYINKDPDILVKYLYKKLKGKMRHYIYMDKLDLSKRIRRDNSNELPNDLYKGHFTEITFDEDRYLFSLSKKIFGYREEFRFFIDNKIVLPTKYYIQDDEDWYRIYIPCELITPTSIMEVERYDKSEIRIKLTSEETKTGKFKITKPDGYYNLYMNNLHIYQEDTLEYVHQSNYIVTVHDEYLDEDIVLTNQSRASITNEAIITITAKKYIGTPLIVYFKTFPRWYCNNEPTVDKYTDVFNDVEIDRGNVRVFMNGQFYSPFTFIGELLTDAPNIFNRTIKLYIKTDIQEGIPYMLDVLPCNNQLEYFKQGECCTENGFVDTGSALSLPFDLKWYDVYVNGLKLNKSNVEIISPNKFFIQGIPTKRNLEIWLRGDVPNELTFSGYDNTINDTIWDIPDFREIIESEKEIIDDDMDDIFDDVVIDIIAEWLEFVNRFLKYRFINPNQKQLSATEQQRYPGLFDEFNILWLDSNCSVEDEMLQTFINSNVRYDEMRNGQYRFGFTPMYIGSHADALPGEYMCDPLTGLPGVKDATDNTILPGGNINRIVAHKNKFAISMSDNGMVKASMYQLEFNENTTAKLVTGGINILDTDSFELVPMDTHSPNKISFSIDADVLEVGYNNVMRLSDYTPVVTIRYETRNLVGGNSVEGVFTGKLDTLYLNAFDIENTTMNGFILKSITLDNDPDITGSLDDKKIILHSILVGF